MGKTRIGMETGDAMVDHVGIRAKLDYTAQGNAIDIAARLEAAKCMSVAVLRRAWPRTFPFVQDQTRERSASALDRQRRLMS